jgi:multidrug efflux pump subunit AcrB
MVLQLEDPTEEEQLFLSEIGIPEQKIVFEENKLELLIALGLAVFLIFVLLASQFESYKLPLKLMSVLPISFFTLSIGLFITGKSFSLNSLLGILVLFGLSINNAIILFETYEQRNKECPHHFINVFHGSLERIKPILITTFTTIIAMIPVAVDPLGMKAQSGLAIAIIAGLIGSTLLTFFIIPPLFIRHYHKD